MKTIHEINKHYDALNTQIYTNNGAFFAFSDKQLQESKKPGVEYVTLGYGLICPKENAKMIYVELNILSKNKRKAIIDTVGAKGLIEYEYFNYETHISGELDDLIDAIQIYVKEYPELFTEDVINDTINKCYRYACDNDLF